MTKLDDGEIESVDMADGTRIRVGFNGVARFSLYAENGQMAEVAWVAAHDCDNVVIERINVAHVARVVYYRRAQAGPVVPEHLLEPEAEFSSRRSLEDLKKAAWRACNAHLQGPDLGTDWGARLNLAMETLREVLRGQLAEQRPTISEQLLEPKK